MAGRFATGLLAGAIAGAAVGAGVTYVAMRHPAPAIAPLPPTSEAVPDTKKPRKGRKAGRGGEEGVASSRGGEEEPVPELTAADRAVVSEGDALRAGATTVDMSGAGGEVRDLGQDEIDAAIGRRAQAIIRCITDARGAAPLSGRVVAGMVVGADGRVVKSRVEAPAWLVRHGLAGCARRELEALRFPAAGKETVVTVPFDIGE